MNLQSKSNEKLVQHRINSYVIFSQICTCRDSSALQKCGLGGWTFLCNVYPIYLSTLESWVLKAFGKWFSGSKYSRRVRCNVNKKRKCDWQTRQILTARSEEQYQVWISFLYSACREQLKDEYFSPFYHGTMCKTYIQSVLVKPSHIFTCRHVWIMRSIQFREKINTIWYRRLEFAEWLNLVWPWNIKYNCHTKAICLM